MDKREMMTINGPEGEKEEVEVLMFFELEASGNSYVIYTKNEIDEKNLATIYVSKVVDKDDEIFLEEVVEEEWPTIKDIIKETIKENRE